MSSEKNMSSSLQAPWAFLTFLFFVLSSESTATHSHRASIQALSRRLSPRLRPVHTRRFAMELAPTLLDATSSSALLLQRAQTLAGLSFSVTPNDDPALRHAFCSKELQAAVEAVRLGSRVSKAVQNQLSGEEKLDKLDELSSPVTVADYSAQALIAWSLSKSDSHTRLSMVAEEDSAYLRSSSGQALVARITELVNAVLKEDDPSVNLSDEDVLDLIDLGNSDGGPSGRHWVLDPIDGTRGFVGMRQYAVCLGLIQDGEVVLGVLGCPNIPLSQVTEADGGQGALARATSNESVGTVFFAHAGCGAYAAPLWGDHSFEAIRRIRVDDVPAPFTRARFMEAFEAQHSNHSVTAALAGAVGVSLPPFRMDSQVKYGILSRGDASVFMHFPSLSYKEKIWDHAAGFVIVEEAGGKVTDASGRRLDFSRGRELDIVGGIVAGPPTLHAALITAVETLGIFRQ